MLGPPPLMAGQFHPSHAPRPQRRRARVEACGAFVAAVRRFRSSSFAVHAASVQSSLAAFNSSAPLAPAATYIHGGVVISALFDHSTAVGTII